MQFRNMGRKTNLYQNLRREFSRKSEERKAYVEI